MTLDPNYHFFFQAHDPLKRVWFFREDLATLEDLYLCVDKRDGDFLPYFFENDFIFVGYHALALRPTLDILKKLFSWYGRKAEVDFFHRQDIKGFNSHFHWKATSADEVLQLIKKRPYQLPSSSSSPKLVLSDLNDDLSSDEINVLKKFYPHKTIPKIAYETVIQTWSEHCSHKVFKATIHHRGMQLQLFRDCIRAPSMALKRPYVVSAFTGNAGIVKIDDQTAIALKMETHNTPSALEPIHGAATGITGVVRDVMCVQVPARPVALWNALFLQDPSSLVVEGVALGGNQLGLPTISGNLSFHPAFQVKPLVFCGAMSVLDLPLPKTVNYDEASIVLVGGLTGRDGLHGAVQSSSTNSAQSSIVQYAYPYQQWELVDFLQKIKEEIIDLTDCGAGGLSSAVGEMSSSAKGSVVFLDKVPLRHSLEPWEIWCSESQERIVLATHHFSKIKMIANKMGIRCSEIGFFTPSGKIDLYDSLENLHASISLDLLFNCQPLLHLKAIFPTQPLRKLQQHQCPTPSWSEALTRILNAFDSHPSLIEHWDGEVQGMRGERSYCDSIIGHGGSVFIKEKNIGVVLGTSGNWGVIDGARAALKAFDEAFRNAVCMGMDLTRLSALDNFSWVNVYPSANNPLAEEKLGILTDCCLMLKKCVENYRIPFVSGKDSMMNERKIDGEMQMVIPTLVITLVGPIVKTRAKKIQQGHHVYLIPPLYSTLQFSELTNHYSNYETPEPFDYLECTDMAQILQNHKIANELPLEAVLVDVARGGVMTSLYRHLRLRDLKVELKQKDVTMDDSFAEGIAGYLVFSPTPLDLTLIGEVVL